MACRPSDRLLCPSCMKTCASIKAFERILSWIKPFFSNPIPAALNVDRSAPPPNRHGGRRTANHAFVFACKRRGCRPEPVPGLDPGIGRTNGTVRRVGINGRWYKSVECLLPIHHRQMLAYLCDRVADEGWTASFRRVSDEGSDIADANLRLWTSWNGADGSIVQAAFLATIRRTNLPDDSLSNCSSRRISVEPRPWNTNAGSNAAYRRPCSSRLSSPSVTRQLR
jgi:hypothetical protein